MRNIIVILCLLLIRPCYGQVTTTFESSDAFESNKSMSRMSLDQIPLKIMPYVDVGKILKEDAEANPHLPIATGYVIPVNYSLEDGKWEETPTHRKWSLRVKSEGAYALNFLFSKLNLAPGAELYVSNEEGSMVFGPVTSEYNKENYTTDVLSGDEAILYLTEPLLADQLSEIQISGVIHSGIDIFNTNVIHTRWEGDADACHVDFSCYPEYAQFGNAVVQISFLLDNKQRNGSAAFVNNTAKDGKMYLLTAFHNIDIDAGSVGVLTPAEIQRAEEWDITLRYQTGSCNGQRLSGLRGLRGLTLRAAWQDSDFALLVENPARVDPLSQCEVAPL